jgi:2-octaprenyl-6-methoxyphenol hydroxylase
MDATVQHTRIAICGAGPVGLALAAMLVRRGIDAGAITLIDAKPLATAVQDPRSLALSHGSRQLLESLGAWPIPATPIHQIHVSRRGYFGRSLIDRGDEGVEALGHVTRYGELAGALVALCERSGVRALRPVRVSGIDEQESHATLHLDDGRLLQADLVIQAEGGVFGEQDEKARTRDYRQSAVIARVTASAPIAHRAYERFTDEGPLALLPQAGADGHQYALVWCARPGTAEALLALDDQGFLARLGDAFGERLGTFTATSARASYKLGLNAQARATARTAAIGNAAQTLHPVAGQGLNLGLRDAAVLARLLGKDASPEGLAQFTAARALDRGVIVGMTDTMARVFTAPGPLQTALGISLAAFDTIGPARSLLAELMMFGRR